MTGRILARGSCKALRWMALFGVVFALGVGQAAAQTVAVEAGKLTTLAEGGALVPVTAVVTVPAEHRGQRLPTLQHASPRTRRSRSR